MKKLLSVIGYLLQYSEAVWAESCPMGLFLQLSTKRCLWGSVLAIKKLKREDTLTLAQAQAFLRNCPCTLVMLLQKHTRFLLKNLKGVTSLMLFPVESTCLLAVLKHINNLRIFFM